MQQLNAHSLLKETPRLINQVIDQLFDTTPVTAKHEDVTLLTPQPVDQRRSFLHQAIKHHYKVVLQVVPAGSEGYPENIRGRVQALGKQRYLLTNRDVTYLLNFNQIRYIAHLD